VLSEQQARESVDAGARFLVSPGTDAALTAAMISTGATVLAEALTPSEVMATRRCGPHVFKLFPASLGGPGYLR
jgi:2-dehydro-3-deoxyphosphogluconate aldolase/(4S)-4-hydroxy-2-oxoglutarate aldolase